MASDLKSKTDAISAISSQPLPSIPKIDIRQAISNIGMQVYAETVQNNANEYLNKIEQIKALNLGEDETQKRLSGLADKSPYLSMMSPFVKQQQQNLKRESDPLYKKIKSESAMDRLKESLAINDLNTIRNSVNSSEDFKVKSSQLKKDTEMTLKRGASSEFIQEYSARSEYGVSSIPTMASLRRGVTSNRELVNTFIKGSTNEFMNAVRLSGRNSPTMEEFSNHFDTLLKNTVENTGEGLSEVRKTMIDLLVNQPDLSLAEEAFKKYPGFFDQGDITKTIPEAIKSRTQTLGLNSLPMTPIDAEVRAFNQVGRSSNHIPNAIVTSDFDREVKIFLDSKALNYMSPETLGLKIRQDPAFTENAYLISNIQHAFKTDFESNPGAALISRGVVAPGGWIKLQGLSSDEKGIPIIDQGSFFTSVKNRTQEMLKYKNEFYQKTDYIDMVFDSEEVKLIASAISRMSPQESWHFSYKIFDTINQANKNIAVGHKPINALNNMKKVIQDDPLLVIGLGMSESAPTQGFQTYVNLKHSELKNQADFSTLQSIAVAGVTMMTGVNTSRIPDTVRDAAASFLMAEHIATQGTVLKDDKVIVTEKISSFHVGNSSLLLYRESRPILDIALKKHVFQYKGKNEDLYNLVYQGNVMLENAPYSMNKFYVRIPRDNIDAMSNIGNYYIDPKTQKRFEIVIDGPIMGQKEGVIEYLKRGLGWS